jgi:hypothetical protein
MQQQLSKELLSTYLPAQPLLALRAEDVGCWEGQNPEQQTLPRLSDSACNGFMLGQRPVSAWPTIQAKTYKPLWLSMLNRSLFRVNVPHHHPLRWRAHTAGSRRIAKPLQHLSQMSAMAANNQAVRSLGSTRGSVFGGDKRGVWRITDCTWRVGVRLCTWCSPSSRGRTMPVVGRSQCQRPMGQGHAAVALQPFPQHTATSRPTCAHRHRSFHAEVHLFAGSRILHSALAGATQ